MDKEESLNTAQHGEPASAARHVFDRAVAMPASLGEAEDVGALRGQLMRSLQLGEVAHAALLMEQLFAANPQVKELRFFGRASGGGLSAEAMVEPPGLGEVVSNGEHAHLLRQASRMVERPTEEQRARWTAGMASSKKVEDMLDRAVIRLRECSPFMATLVGLSRSDAYKVGPSSAPDIAAALGYPEVGAAIEAARLGKVSGPAPAGSRRKSL